MTAKSFCYACLGIFLLVAAWTMGAQHAGADSNPKIAEVFEPVDFIMDHSGRSAHGMAIDTEGRCYEHRGDTVWGLETTVPLQGRTLLAVAGYKGGPSFQVLFTNGDMMHYEYNLPPYWFSRGNIFGGTVSDVPELPEPSWSEIKKAYRDEDE